MQAFSHKNKFVYVDYYSYLCIRNKEIKLWKKSRLALSVVAHLYLPISEPMAKRFIIAPMVTSIIFFVTRESISMPSVYPMGS